MQQNKPESQERSNRYHLFSTSTYPLSKNSRLWRYLTFEKFVWLFEYAKLFHVRLDCLEDKFEGAVTKSFAEKGYQGLIKGIKLADGTSLSKEEAIKAKLIPAYTQIDRIRDEYSRAMLRITNYVSCWHVSDYESHAMWRAYCNTDSGVAIVSTMKRIAEATDLSSVQSGILGPVEYFDFDKDSMFLGFGRVGRPGFSKRKEFQSEKEVRGMIYVPLPPLFRSTIEDWNELAKRMPFGFAVDVDLPTLIEEIYVGPNSPDWVVELVCAVSKRRGLVKIVHRSRLCDSP